MVHATFVKKLIAKNAFNTLKTRAVPCWLLLEIFHSLKSMNIVQISVSF